MSSVSLEIQSVSKTFRSGDVIVPVISDVSLAIGHKEIVLIMGPSGSGKTTLLSLMGLLLTPDSGEVLVAGQSVQQLGQKALAELRLHQLGFVFQDSNLLASLNAWENVTFVGQLGGVENAGERATEILSALGLKERQEFKVSKLSLGEKQRVALARALINKPSVILADEPTANLDAKHGQQIMETLQRTVKNGDHSVVVVSHDPRIVDMADRIYYLQDGKLDSQSRVK